MFKCDKSLYTYPSIYANNGFQESLRLIKSTIYQQNLNLFKNEISDNQNDLGLSFMVSKSSYKI